MKKTILTTFVLALFFSTSCNKDDDDNNGNGSLNPVQVQRALLVESTGTWCQYCPNGAETLITSEHLYSDILPVAVHLGDVMTTPTSEAWESNFPASGVPNFYVGNDDVGQSPNGAIAATTILSPTAGVGHTWNKEGTSYQVSSRVKFYESANGEFYVGCYYIHGSIDACGSYSQVDATGATTIDANGCNVYLQNTAMIDAVQDAQGVWQGVYLINEGDIYTHEHVIGGHAGTNVWGELLGVSSVSSGQEYDFNFTINEGFGWTQDGKILTVLWKKTGNTYEFINGYMK